jgi:hypothetical protein
MQPAFDNRPRVTNRDEAERMVRALMDLMGTLTKVLNEETALVKSGRISDALNSESRKGELSANYLKSLEALKANAVALARFAPAALEDLKTAHTGFSKVIEKNQTVLATARAVSEGLIRSLADEISAKSRPSHYGPATGAPRASGTGPMVLSRKL